VSGFDDPGCDEVGEVVHGGFDAVLDDGAGEVVIAEWEMDGLVGVESSCFEPDGGRPRRGSTR
jgi:hypothetical protein